MAEGIRFDLIPYNNSGASPLRTRVRGSFVFDILFTTNNKPGFVVQYIRKKLTYRGNPASPWLATHHDYWEIFHITKDGESWNADRFAQTAIDDAESEGCFIQIGYAYFFPYSGSVKMEDNNIEITPELQKIFGDWVEGHKIAYANGLPSSSKQPAMKGLRPLESAIIHKLTGNWGPHVEEKHASLPADGWNTLVDEDVFSGPLIYQAFPWKYRGSRPLLKEASEKKALTQRQWKKAAVALVRPPEFLGPVWCPKCSPGVSRPYFAPPKAVARAARGVHPPPKISNVFGKRVLRKKIK
jgi:hypothetical protein